MRATATITKEITIPDDLTITVELPPECLPGEAAVIVVVHSQGENRMAELYGKYKGSGLSEALDAPMEEEFAEYM